MKILTAHSIFQPDIKSLQIQLTGFLESQTPEFCKELWTLLLSAQTNAQGIPRELLEAKKLELIQEKARRNEALSSRHRIQLTQLSPSRSKPKKPLKKHAVIQTGLAGSAANALFGSGSQGVAVSPKGAVAMIAVEEVDPREPMMALVL